MVSMISLLLNINWSFLKILFLSFLSNISIVLIYIDYLPYISFLYWIVLFLFIFKKQFFLYFPVFLIVYFSILFFINTLIKENKLKFAPCEPLLYTGDGVIFYFPVAKEFKKYATLRWYPMVFSAF